ncbi:MAG: hypothetical protein B7Z12_17515 [Caulobacter vibrioides]|uniref:Uncharacterized protein n=1 Tax=Caulobacter vibrioides TaxID=155892 RepID=A0A258CVW9_CAUVI|nr:MAG: hypothetical protein B7Z12_17515 [Caulobacter vibrioides]
MRRRWTPIRAQSPGCRASRDLDPKIAPSVSLRIRSDPPPPQAGQEGCNILLTHKTGEVARRRQAT